MGQQFSRGTLTRARWDYFERTDGIAMVWGQVVSGPIGAYFANNSSGSLAIDVYNFQMFSSVTTIWDVLLLLPPLVLTPITLNDAQVMSLQPDHAQPAGVVGMFSALTSNFRRLQRVSNGAFQLTMTPIPGSYFITLPPGWALSVFGNPGANPAELSMTTWYQEVTDNIAPAV